MSPLSDNHVLSALNWSIHDDPTLQTEVDNCLKRTDWDHICEIASQCNGGQPCKVLPKCTSGGTSLARLLEFQDGTYWVVRVHYGLKLILSPYSKPNTHTPVPRIFAFNLGDVQPETAAFVLLELLPGNSAMDEARGYDKTDWGLIPRQHRQTLHRSLAAAHVQIASARLPLIGTVSRDTDGNFTVGPIPGIGGPFDTAASFIRAWATNMRYPYDEAYLRKYVPSHFLDEIIKGNDEFPKRLADLATSGKYFTRAGPFPIRHADLFHQNIIVTKSFDVLGVIDWEGACTMPWELVDLPSFIQTVPRLINDPNQYDEAGQPIDPDEIGMWADEKAYVEMVREAEDTQDLAGIVHLFVEGKMGLYGRALDYFENK
ncbi:hypothetical protein F5Y13DRAFT_198541 [Hypoxylon sp. FL1857]|nr:hypothetical protein F5Y13DRAFT_198541 [Hypoxylon sp. FL1857]